MFGELCYVETLQLSRNVVEEEYKNVQKNADI